MATLPLEGLRVIDLTQFTAGPFCTRMLADYGADVVKIERKGVGDPARSMPPFYHDTPGVENSGLFLFLNTNKRSVELDFSNETDRAALIDLVADSDVLVESLRPGALDRLGLGYETLREINPKLVMTSITNFGQDGPYRDWEGTDLTIWAMGGAMNTTGHPNHEPLKLAGHAPTYHLGYVAALATMVSLFGTDVRGTGEHLDVNFFRSAMHSIDLRLAFLMGYEYTGFIRPRERTALGLGSGTRECADGFFNTTVVPLRFPDFARMIDAEHLLEIPEWATPAARMEPERYEEIEAYVVPWMLERTKKEVRALHQEFGVLGGPLNTIADLFEDEQFARREFFHDVEHPTTGAIKYPGYHFNFRTEETRPSRKRAPLLGEHSQEVMAEVDHHRPRNGSKRTVWTTPLMTSERSPLLPNEGRLPLEGIRIIDMTVVWAGPYATQFLADWGAEVIRVESLNHFAPMTRGSMARPPQSMAGTSFAAGYANADPGERPWNRVALFNGHGRNKRAMTVDLTKSEGQEVLHDLVRRSDGLIENNLPSSVEQVDMTWEKLSKVNPQLVMVRQPAFGLEGPYKNYRTFGGHMECILGHPLLRAHPDTDISLEYAPGGVPSDAAGGVGSAYAFLLGLLQRKRTGKGVYIEHATAENYAAFLGDFIMDYSMNGRVQERLGNTHPTLAPHNAYRCAGDDRWVTIAVTSEHEWQSLCSVMGNDALAKDDRFGRMEDRWRNRDALDKFVTSWTAERDAFWIMHRLQSVGVPAGVVMREPDAFADQHLQAQGFWQTLEQPEVGTHRYPTMAWTASQTPNHLRRHAPRLGEDNQYVYKELLGFSDERYKEFEESGHIGTEYHPSVR